MKGNDRLLSRRDIEPSTAKYTFYCVLRSLGFGLFTSAHNDILQHSVPYFSHYSIIRLAIPESNGIDFGDEMDIICLPGIK